MRLLTAILLLAVAASSLEAGPFQGRRRARAGYSRQQDGDPNLILRWDQVHYKLEKGTLTQVQQAQLEASLRNWCRCPVRRVEQGENLSIRIQPFARGGVCVTGGPVAKIIVDPSHPDGFQEVMDHEVRHLVQPFFHPE